LSISAGYDDMKKSTSHSLPSRVQINEGILFLIKNKFIKV